jgi:hypothetical protein
MQSSSRSDKNREWGRWDINLFVQPRHKLNPNNE